MSSRTIPYAAFAIAAPGLSSLVAAELRELGVEPTAVGEAGVEFRADPAGLYRANVHLRVASRVVIRVASFRAAHFSELEKQARRVPWERWIPGGGSVTVRVTSRKSRLYHSDAVAERLHGAIARRAGSLAAAATRDDDDADTGPQLVVARLDRDHCTLSVDSSGALLHRRGYRLALAGAPLRETLAAAILRAAGWSGGTPLVDPFCGSGTIPIEAALMARRIAPGLHRSFAMERWPEFSNRLASRVKEAAAESILPTSPVSIAGSDRDAGAVEAARANAARAGVDGDIDFERRAISDLEPPAARAGHLVTNPPYGERLGDASALRALYARLGQVIRAGFPGWRVALLTSDPALVRHVGLPLAPALETSNGGIRVSLWVSEGEAGAGR